MDTANSEKLQIFEILARQHEAMLLAFVLSLIPEDPQLAEDVVQESFLIAYRKISTLRDKNAFPHWLRGIARFEAFAALQNRGREIPLEPMVLEGIEDVFGALDQQEGADQWQDRARLVEDCYRHLPDMLQQVCRLHYFEDRKARDVAESLQIGLAAVLKRLERARDAIRQCVEKRLKLEEA